MSRLEVALARSPQRRDLQTNLAAGHKLARQAQDALLRLSEVQHIEVCNYRLLPEAANGYSLSHVSRSLFEYQNLFSQIYDALKNGKKERAVIGREAMEQSDLEFAYSYSGSLGVVLFAQSERQFFEGGLDSSIDALFQVLEIDGQHSVRDVANNLGRAVVKRVHDWSGVNIDGGFATDVRWNRSDGRQLGEVIERRRMEKIVGIINATSDKQTETIEAKGMLIGGNIKSRSFHFAILDGKDYRGYLDGEFDNSTSMTLGKTYNARIRETKVLHYALEKMETTYELLSLAAQLS